MPTSGGLHCDCRQALPKGACQVKRSWKKQCRQQDSEVKVAIPIPGEFVEVCLERVNAELSAALLAFNGEAVVYCQGISDTVAHEYAMEYVRMLQNRAKGVEAKLPRVPAGPFEHNHNLIRSTLERIWAKYFPKD